MLLVAVVLVMLVVSGPLASSIGVGDRAQRPGRHRLEHREVAGDRAVRRGDRRDPLLRDPQREAAEVPLDVGRGASSRSWCGCWRRSAFALYVATFGSYDKTYGSLAGAVVGLLWLWITNLALLFGAELDSELERGRQLQAGIAAEEELQLPARDTRGITKARKKEQKDIAAGRRHPASSTTRRPDRHGDRRATDTRHEGEDIMRKLTLLVAFGWATCSEPAPDASATSRSWAPSTRCGKTRGCRRRPSRPSTSPSSRRRWWPTR